MTSKKHLSSDVTARMTDEEGIAHAFEEALEETRQRHIKMGHHSAAWRDGRVILVNPVDLTEIKAQRDSA